MIFIPVVRNAGSLGNAFEKAFGPPQFIVPKDGGEVNEEFEKNKDSSFSDGYCFL
jgi:hypothetical protein